MIKFDYKGKAYELGYNRDTVRSMESSGFSLDELSTKPATMIPALFHGAFAMNHRATRKHTDDIYAALKGRDKLVGALVEEYIDTVNSLIGDDESEGNVEWERTK